MASITSYRPMLGFVIAMTLLVAGSWSQARQKKKNNSCGSLCSEIQTLKKTIADLSKQVMLQQLYAEERIRNEGESGIQVIRGGPKGLHNYDGTSHLRQAVFAIHDHSNYDRTVGLGEMTVVLNGIDFRTRHNDYKLVMPSTTSGEHHATEDIPFPEVPPEVLSKRKLEDQIAEMREWFRAFKDQDRSVRDYTKYFKPVLCYMEGAWTLDENLEDPFPSDRHVLDATSWEDLREKVRYAAYTGSKNRLENLALLPTSIFSIDPVTGTPTYAQWNYRILCSPISFDIPFSFLQQEDDLSFRVSTGRGLPEVFFTRAARFKLFDSTRNPRYQILDEIFATIPGKNNYGANLTLSAFREDMYDVGRTDQRVLLNTAYYHRSYKTLKNGAGGIEYSAFGFNDENMWVAQTTQPRIAPIPGEDCVKAELRPGRLKLQCVRSDIRISYAIPLEIIFMTPLLSWNPYNFIINKDTTKSVEGGRTGATEETALKGVDKLRYYMTPVDFFSGSLDKSDPADTVRGYMYVSDRKRKARKVSASGTRVVLQDIEGVGKIRLRYPIAPVHGEGSSVWKELNALRNKIYGAESGPPASVDFEMSLSVKDPPGEHTHEFSMSYDEFQRLLVGEKIHVTTEESQEHSHDLIISYLPESKSFRYIGCDGRKNVCWDGHPRDIHLITHNSFTELP